MNRIKTIISVMLSLTLLKVEGFSQTPKLYYNVLNGATKAATVNQNIISASNRFDAEGNFSRSTLPSSAAANAVVADQTVKLTYAVSTRVALDMGLLNRSISQRIADLVSLQDQNRDNQPYVKMLQDDITDLNFLWDDLFGPNPSCPYISFVGYSAHVNADVKYKDVLTGVGLMREQTGVVNFANIPYAEIEGQTKATTLIYQK